MTSKPRQAGQEFDTCVDGSSFSSREGDLIVGLPVVHVLGPVVDAVAVGALEGHDDGVHLRRVAGVAEQVPALIVDGTPHLHAGDVAMAPVHVSPLTV